MTSDLGSLGYGKRFQKHRKLFHSMFSQVQVHTYEDAQAEGARILLKDLMDAPESYNSLVARLAFFLHWKFSVERLVLKGFRQL